MNVTMQASCSCKLRKIYAAILLIIASLSLFSCSNTVEVYADNGDYPPLSTSSHNSFIYDISSEELTIFSSGKSDIIRPASTTKLLVALLALEILPQDTEITPGDEVYLPPENSSSAFIRPHHTLTLEMLIEAMIIPSGNDAAYAIAAACGREIADNDALDCNEAVAVFVDEMNSYAKRLGCTGSNFTTPDGFAGNEHYSTTYDMAIIAKNAADCELIMKYAAMQSDSVIYASGHTNTWINTNLQLDPESIFYNENVVGLKTGSLDDSYSLITVYDDGRSKFIIGVFGAENDSARYNDTAILIEAILNKKSSD